VGAILAAICFFLPWVKFSCSGIEKTASGSELGGILWLVLLAALVVVGAFFFFRNQGQIQKSKPIILVSSIVALAVMIVRYIIFMSGEKTQFGTIRPQDIGLSFQFGAIGTLIGFIVALFGTTFLKSDEPASTTGTEQKG
jgi:Co/Zn/Cd efflux system component